MGEVDGRTDRHKALGPGAGGDDDLGPPLVDVGSRLQSARLLVRDVCLWLVPAGRNPGVRVVARSCLLDRIDPAF